MNAREVTEFLLLKPGEYLIVPSTYSPNETASFILTIYSKTETHGWYAQSLSVCLLNSSMAHIMNYKCFITVLEMFTAVCNVFCLSH